MGTQFTRDLLQAAFLFEKLAFRFRRTALCLGRTGGISYQSVDQLGVWIRSCWFDDKVEQLAVLAVFGETDDRGDRQY